MNLPPYILVYQTGRIVWRGFCCCELHALVRAARVSPPGPNARPCAVPVPPEHPERRAHAS